MRYFWTNAAPMFGQEGGADASVNGPLSYVLRLLSDCNEGLRALKSIAMKYKWLGFETHVNSSTCGIAYGIVLSDGNGAALSWNTSLLERIYGSGCLRPIGPAEWDT